MLSGPPRTPNLLPRHPRDTRIDFWRGLCLVGMIAWHLLTHPSYPRWLAFAVIKPFNFVAEGFVMLAGVAVGLQAAGRRIAIARSLKRAGSILLVNYGLMLFVIVVSVVERRFGVGTPAQLPDSVLQVLTLRYQPYLADVLTLFVFLFAAAPVFEYLRRAFGELALIGLSILLYFTAVIFPLNEHGAFIFNSWQIFFVAGIILGARYWALGRSHLPTAAQIALTATAFTAIAGMRWFVSGPDIQRVEGWQTLVVFSRKPLTIARIAYVALEMLLIAQVTLRWWPAIKDLTMVRWITLLGEQSLPVFVASVVLDYLLKAMCDIWALGTPSNLVLLAVEFLILFGVAAVMRQRPELATGAKVS